MNGRHAVAICHRGSAYGNSNSSRRHVVREEGRLKRLQGPARGPGKIFSGGMPDRDHGVKLLIGDCWRWMGSVGLQPCAC